MRLNFLSQLALCSGHVSESVSSFDFVDDQFFADLERTERVEAQFVFDKMRELLERIDDDGQGMRRAADLGRVFTKFGDIFTIKKAKLFKY